MSLVRRFSLANVFAFRQRAWAWGEGGLAVGRHRAGGLVASS